MEITADQRRRLGKANARQVKLAVSGPPQVDEIVSEIMGNMMSPEQRSRRWAKHEILSRAQIPTRHRKPVPEGNDERSRLWWGRTETICGKVGSGALLALLGNRGTGKTQAAVAAMVHSAKAGRSCLYTKAMEIFLDIRATYSRPDASELDALKKYLDPRLLVIDEIQQRGESDFENRILAYLIDKRYDAMADTLLIGNLTPTAMADSLDPSIVDRLRETGGVIEFAWESFRANPASAAPVTEAAVQKPDGERDDDAPGNDDAGGA